MRTTLSKWTSVLVAFAAPTLGSYALAGSGGAAGANSAPAPAAASIESTMHAAAQPGSSVPIRIANSRRMRAAELRTAYPGIPHLPCSDATEIVCADVAGKWNLPPPAPKIRPGAPVPPTPEPPPGLLARGETTGLIAVDAKTKRVVFFGIDAEQLRNPLPAEVIPPRPPAPSEAMTGAPEPAGAKRVAKRGPTPLPPPSQ